MYDNLDSNFKLLGLDFVAEKGYIYTMEETDDDDEADDDEAKYCSQDYTKM